MGIVENPVRIHLSSSAGEGISEPVVVEGGTTVGELYEEYAGGDFGDATVRVNAATEKDYDRVLREGDRVVFAPKKIIGA